MRPQTSSHRWTRAILTGLLLSAFPALNQALEVDLRVRADQPGDTISRHLYGQFAEHLGRGIYEGIWVGEDSEIPNTRGFRDDVLTALRELQIPVIRWPGGCFADEYHWQDGIEPRDERPVRINTHWGWVIHRTFNLRALARRVLSATPRVLTAGLWRVVATL